MYIPKVIQVLPDAKNDVKLMCQYILKEFAVLHHNYDTVLMAISQLHKVEWNKEGNN